MFTEIIQGALKKNANVVAIKKCKDCGRKFRINYPFGKKGGEKKIGIHALDCKFWDKNRKKTGTFI